jgi:hypothetical protein
MKPILLILAAATFLSPIALAEAERGAAKDFPRASQVIPFGSPTQHQSCCKICIKGKACGNTCIARDRTCHVGPGCACNG